MAAIVMISSDGMKTLCSDDPTFDDKSLHLDRRRLRRFLVIDCRPFIAFNAGHIVGALNVHCPPIVKRRSGGSLQLQNVISSDEMRSEFLNGQYEAAVFYDDRTTDLDQLTSDSVVQMAIKVVQETQRTPKIYFLQGGYDTFVRRCGHLCRTGQLLICSAPSIPSICVTSSSTPSPDLVQSTEELSLDGTRLTIATSGMYDALSPCDVKPEASFGDICREECASSTPPQNSARFRPLQDQGDPVFILPWLYLGNSYHASQDERLLQLGVTTKLNVAGQHPSLSYSQSRDFRCMSIPVTDTSTENISSWFPKAIEFIDLTRRSQGKVLVHCQAGISRSATICIAYLMHHKGLSLDQAYDFIQARRSIISPNMNFMRQLAEYEKQLQSTETKETKPSSSSSSASFSSSSSSSSSSFSISSSSYASLHRRAPVASLSSIASRLQRPCRPYELTPRSLSAVTATSCSITWCGRLSSPSISAASPYSDQKHGKTARRHRRASLDLGLQFPVALPRAGGTAGPRGHCRKTSASIAFESMLWPEKHDDGDGVFPVASEATGLLLPFNRSSPSLSPLLKST